MNYRDFLNEIKNNNISTSYLFIGKEEYLMNDATKMLKDKYIDESFETLNFSIINGKDGDLDSLINACETLPFMSPKKLILLKDVSFFLSNDEKNFEKEFYKHLDNLGEFLCVILMDNDSLLRKNSKIYKYFNKKNQVVEFSKLAGSELNSWITNILNTYDRKMSISNINYFIQHSSYLSRNQDLNLYDLENELLKVINYTKNREIVKEDIDLVLIKTIDTNIFQLLDAIARFDTNSALKTFNDMYILNEPIQRILFMIIRQARLLLGCKLYEQKGYNQREVQEKLQIKAYEFRKISSQSRGFTIGNLEKLLEDLLDIDKKIKTSTRDERLMMEILIVNICNKI